jgi:hypothetical protein
MDGIHLGPPLVARLRRGYGGQAGGQPPPTVGRLAEGFLACQPEPIDAIRQVC